MFKKSTAMNQNSIEAIRKSVKLKYDEHIGKLISIPNMHLSKIVPNRRIPLNDILKGFNDDSGKELFRYGDEILNEISRIIDKLKLSEFSEVDKESILGIVNEYCEHELYLKRFTIVLNSIERKIFSYGQKTDLEKNIIDLNRTICECYARNGTQRIKSKIENELNCLIESYRSKNEELKSKVAEVTDCLELKPNFFGLGINFNAILTKLRIKKKT
jgi:hypothetical protein